ncbi:hypothetical protein [Rahnella sp. CJA17(1/100)]|uniref:hypothetical protein n=1 Tax=Rahnella sp. CJA17(1/100) TaxID=2508951 RepID=UPI00197FDD15|nr:hypothetical protein [Rahnella sp. CJA17(1/100)]
MPTNNFKPFGIGSGANVTDQTAYEALAALLTGFQSGKASSAQINKALRQGTVMANVLAQYIADSAAVDVLDDGVPATILANLKAGILAANTGRLIGAPKIITANQTYTPSPGTKKIFVQGIGTGGNGAGSIATGSTGCACCSGGASGGYAEAWYESGFDSVLVTIGAIGALNYGNGASGGTSSFGSLMIIPGGGGGVAVTQTNSITYFENGGGSVGGVPTLSGHLSGFVTPGSFGIGGKVFNGSAVSGTGATSKLGTGGGNVAIASGSSAGGNGAGYGAGGGGAGVSVSGSAVYGGNATKGMFIVWEYS